MLKIYLYRVKLLDPLFYAKEGLSGAFTSPYLHATAVNLAIKCLLNTNPEAQPFLIWGSQGERNVPKYSNSLVSEDFYFTPSRLVSPLKYFPEVTKGENDGYIFKTGMGELFQAGILNYISPEAEFEGYLIEKKEYEWPSIIRLGSFRGKALLSIFELEIIKSLDGLTSVSHPVDPLVTPIKRGVLISIFPYPIVENAQSSHVILAKEKIRNKQHIISFPDKWSLPQIEKIRNNKEPIII